MRYTADRVAVRVTEAGGYICFSDRKILVFLFDRIFCDGKSFLGAVLAAPTLFSHPLLLRRQSGFCLAAFAGLQGWEAFSAKCSRARQTHPRTHMRLHVSCGWVFCVVGAVVRILACLIPSLFIGNTCYFISHVL